MSTEKNTGGVVRRRADGARRKKITAEELIKGVLEGDRAALARAITISESNAQRHADISQKVLNTLLPKSGGSIRIGITGVPGAGKSTLIEALGCYLCEQGKRVAVLAVDPSSSVSGGSVMGDKTRMRKLGSYDNAFIRPSPTGGTLGGVTRKSREAIVLCEAAGYDVLLIETVGTGQSETTVRSMVDFFVLVLLAGGGDELQGIKKGVVEISDAILVNKADGENKIAAQAAAKEYSMALKYLTQATRGWTTPALTCSAIANEGIEDFWKVVDTFRKQMTDKGVISQRRQNQRMEWVASMVESHFKESFYKLDAIKNILPDITQQVKSGALSTSGAAKKLLLTYYQNFDTSIGLSLLGMEHTDD